MYVRAGGKAKGIWLQSKKRTFSGNSSGLFTLPSLHCNERTQEEEKLKHTDWGAESESAPCGQVPWICCHILHECSPGHMRPQWHLLRLKVWNKTPVGFKHIETHLSTVTSVQVLYDSATILRTSPGSALIVFCCVHGVILP